jgi:DNA-binding LytR/AlgR family response regulator
MLNILIIDDEPLAQDVLETYVSQFPELNLVAKCLNAIEANEWLKSTTIDLIFLDIQMPMISGLDFLKTLKNPPLVIITTAYPNHAIEGFELNVLDYLLKPISMERFIKAINKAFELVQLHKNQTLEKNNSEKEPEDYFFVKADKKLCYYSYGKPKSDYFTNNEKPGRKATYFEIQANSPILYCQHRPYKCHLGKYGGSF